MEVTSFIAKSKCNTLGTNSTWFPAMINFAHVHHIKVFKLLHNTCMCQLCSMHRWGKEAFLHCNL